MAENTGKVFGANGFYSQKGIVVGGAGNFEYLKTFTEEDKSKFPKGFVIAYDNGLHEFLKDEARRIWEERFNQKSDKEVLDDIINGRYTEWNSPIVEALKQSFKN